MADIAASVLAKPKNKAKASGISYQQCLQLFFQEEFLRKIYITQYFANNTQIKGAASGASLICVLHINLILFYRGSVCIITQYFF